MTRIWVAMLTVAMGAALLIAVPVLASDSGDDYGLVDPATGVWHLDEGLQQLGSFYYGNPGDYPFMGDWDCDGDDTPGLYRQSDGYVYLRNSNTQGVADVSFFFGNPGDVPIAGDFNGDGCDTVSIYRPSEQRFYIINHLGTNDGGLGAAEYSFIFGNPGDKPFVGDFNGSGQDTIGLHRESTGLVYFRNTNTTGIADNQFYFGDPGDRFVAGDWTGDAVDTPALFRPSNTSVYWRLTNTQGNADWEWYVSEAEGNWLPVAGRFGLCATQTSIPMVECQALVALYQSAHRGSEWHDDTGWLTDADPCTWFGVACEDGSVVSIGLSANRLAGPIPAAMGNLSNLRVLDLYANDLGGDIPAELGNLTSLEVLDLDGNSLVGRIPAELGNMTNLRLLSLSFNYLSGPLPIELADLGTLERLYLFDNGLVGLIPAEYGNLVSLTSLAVHDNNLSGPVPPELADLPLISDLWLRGQSGCLTAATPTFAAWLASFDPYWNDGCPAP